MSFRDLKNTLKIEMMFETIDWILTLKSIHLWIQKECCDFDCIC